MDSIVGVLEFKFISFNFTGLPTNNPFESDSNSISPITFHFGNISFLFKHDVRLEFVKTNLFLISSFKSVFYVKFTFRLDLMYDKILDLEIPVYIEDS